MTRRELSPKELARIREDSAELPTSQALVGPPGIPCPRCDRDAPDQWCPYCRGAGYMEVE